LREDYSAEELRTLARRSKAVSQSRRLLSLAAVWPKAHTLWCFSRAGWHITSKLAMPDNITPIFLRSRARS
jgi:hypothetical protein